MSQTKLYIIVGSIIVLLSAEIVARMLGFGETVQVILHDKIEYVLAENQDVVRFGNRININSLGHRSEEIRVTKQENEQRILLVGDSVVYGNHHVDQSETIAHYLTRSLNAENSQGSFSVVSAAASSWGPENMFEYLKDRGLYDSDLMFLVLSTHDMVDFPTFESAVIPYRINKNVAAIDDITYAVFNRVWPRIMAKFESKENEIDFDQALVRSKSIINEIIELTAQNGIATILVFHPTEKESQNDFVDVEFFKNIALENNIEFINLQSAYKNHNIFNLEKVHYDGMHLTASGAELVAGIINEKVVDEMPANSNRTEN